MKICFLKNLSIKKIFHLLFFISVWLSLDTNFENWFFGEKIQDQFIFLRSLLAFIIFIPFVILNYKNFSYNSKNIFLYFFILIFIIQIFTFFFVQKTFIYSYYFFLSIFTIIIFYNVKYNLLKKLFFISLFFVFVLFFLFTISNFVLMLQSVDNSNLYSGFPQKLFYTDYSNNTARSSGLSRLGILINIFSINYVIYKKKYKNFFLATYILSGFFLLLMQSRLAIFFYIIFNIFIFFYFKKKINIKINLYKIILIFFIPIFLSITFGSIKQMYNFKQQEKYFNNNKDNIDKIFIKPHFSDGLIRPLDPQSFTSQRWNDWEKIIATNKNYFLGNGIMGDRYLINQSASNAILYTYASSGILGVAILLVLYFQIGLQSLGYLFIKKFNKKLLFFDFIIIFFISFLVFRSIFETGFVLFGIDYIIFILSLSFLFKKNKIKEKDFNTLIKKIFGLNKILINHPK